MSFKFDLKKIIKGEILDNDQILTTRYSRDASIFQIKPNVVISPKDSEDIKKLVSFINKNPNENLSITVRSAGTDMTGGAINDSIILDMTQNFTRILKIGEDSAEVEPGAFYKDFEEETLKRNLIMPSYPASREICTVGGIVANNAGGERDLYYGQTQEYINELKVILSDGNEYTIKPLTKNELDKKIAQNDFEGKIYSEVYKLIENNRKIIEDAKPKVSKNSTGYLIWEVWNDKIFDLAKLFIGSQGTLGIITRINFKLIKPKTYSTLLVIYLRDFSKLAKVVEKVLEFKPESFECYDDQTLKLSIKHSLDLLKDFKYNNMFFAFLNFLPDLLSNFGNNLPKLTLLANFTSYEKNEALVSSKQAQKAVESIGLKCQIMDSKASAEKFWIIRHKSFGLLRKYSEKGQASSFIDDIIVRPEFLPEFLPKLNKIIEPYKDKMVYTFAGHIGDGNFHIIPLMDLSKDDVRRIIPKIMEKVFTLVFEYGGSMSGEHNDGLIRGPYLPKMYGERIYQLFKQVKEIFDPKNIFNPHKKTDASLSYSLEHMVK